MSGELHSWIFGFGVVVGLGVAVAGETFGASWWPGALFAACYGAAWVTLRALKKKGRLV